MPADLRVPGAASALGCVGEGVGVGSAVGVGMGGAVGSTRVQGPAGWQWMPWAALARRWRCAKRPQFCWRLRTAECVAVSRLRRARRAGAGSTCRLQLAPAHSWNHQSDLEKPCPLYASSKGSGRGQGTAAYGSKSKV